MSVVQAWRDAYSRSNYDFRLNNKSVKTRKTWSRSWRRIMRQMSLTCSSELCAFEVGCGTAEHLVKLALNGWRCVGIDVSEIALRHALDLTNHISEQCGRPLPIELKNGDFLAYSDIRRFDLVFQWGVVEHFLDVSERTLALRKMFELTKPGGYVVSVVPNGTHPLRSIQRSRGLGGYEIAEIDYSCESLTHEMESAGGCEVVVLPHDLFGYLKIISTSTGNSIGRKFIYYLWQMIPQSILPRRFCCRRCFSLIGVARKSLEDAIGKAQSSLE